MRPLNDKLAQKILEAAEAEFFKKGYRGACVRSIAASVGVTTGAIYRYYKNKEALFDALVSEPAQQLFERYRSYSENFSKQGLKKQLTTLPQLSEEPSGEIGLLMGYIYEHYGAFKLIACCGVGTGYENYVERLTQIETKSGITLVRLMQEQNMLKVDVDDTLIHIISNTIFTGIFEIISHDDVKDAKKHIAALYDFYTAGWYRILGIE